MVRKLRVAVLFVLLLLFLSPNHSFAVSRVTILTYHYIRDYTNAKDPPGIVLSVSPANFDAQMKYLSKHGYTPITLDTLSALLNHTTTVLGKPIVLTFDDGYRDFYTNAYPILQKYGFHAVSFIVTGFVGNPAYLSWDNIHSMQSSGLISFEAHTMHHYYLTRMPYANIFIEERDSKNILQSQLGMPVNFIAYPYGAANGSVTRAAQAAGFVGGVGTWGGQVSSVSLNMPRYGVSGKYSVSTFASLL